MEFSRTAFVKGGLKETLKVEETGFFEGESFGGGDVFF